MRLLGCHYIWSEQYPKLRENSSFCTRDIPRPLDGKGLIFDLTTILHRKEIAALTKDKNFFANINGAVNIQIGEHLKAFRDTELTKEEKETLDWFAKRIDSLISMEKKLGIAEGNSLASSDLLALQKKIEGLKDNLRTLSNIQLYEGKQKFIKSDNAVESMYALESVENTLLIIFGVVLLIIIVAIPRTDKIKSSNEPQ